MYIKECGKMDRENLKEKCLNMYLNENKTLEEIAELTGWSRTYITNLMKDDARYKEKKNNRKLKVYKRKTTNQMLIYITTEFIEKLGISKDSKKSEYVDVSFDENTKSIIIKKHS